MDITDVPQWVLAFGGVMGVATGIVTVFQSRATRRRLNAETDKFSADADQVLTQRANTVNAMALGLLEPMERRIRDLTDEVLRLEHEVFALTDRLRLAQRLLDQNRIPFPQVRDDASTRRDYRDRESGRG